MRRSLPALALLALGCPLDVPGGELVLCYCPDGACPTEVETCRAQAAPELVAGGQTTRWAVFVPADTSPNKTLTVTSGLGTLSPDASPPATQTLALLTRGENPVEFSLLVGTTPGEGTLSVTAAGGLEDSETLRVSGLVPCIRLVSVPTPDACDGTAPPAEPEDPADAHAACLATQGLAVTLPANGSTVQLEVTLPNEDLGEDAVAQEVTLRSTLAALRPSAANVDAQQLALAVTPGQPARFQLLPGRTTGVGQVTASLAGQPEVRLEYELTAAEERLLVTGPDPETAPLVADGRAYPFSVQLAGSVLEGPQTLTIRSTLGRVGPASDGGDRYETTVVARPCETVTVDLVTDDPVANSNAFATGTGTFTATLADVTTTTVGYEVTPLLEDVVFVEPPVDDELQADGVSVPTIRLRSSSTRLSDRSITVTSTLGTIGSGQDDHTRTLSIGPQEEVELPLRMGRVVGTEVLTVAEADGFLTDTVQFSVARSYPSFLTLVGTPTVLTVQEQSSSLSAFFGRDDERQVSEGTRVNMVACCADMDPADPCEYVQLPSSIIATTDAPQTVAATLALTPAGVALVDEEGTPPTDNVPVTVHAFVAGPLTSLDSIDCAALDSGGDLGLAATEARSFALQRRPPP
ncbi:MAG: hypothetical protein AAF799_26385 [Myxococcota bacterium]